jgi:hypothetical protein
MKIITTIILAVLFTANIMAQVPNYVPTNGLVGWWPFNGNANDQSGNGNNGTTGSGVTLTSDRFFSNNAAYDFNGSGNISLTSLPTTGAQDFTISGWVKTNNTTVRKGIACWGQDNPWQSTYFFVTNTGYLNFGFAYNGGPQSSTFIADNQWHHVAVTCISGLIQLYLDGQPTATALQMNPNISGTNKALGANIDNSGSNNFNGALDDIGIWNRALTQWEITNLYNSCVKNLAISPTNNNKIIGSNANFTTTTTASNPSYIWQSNFGQGYVTLNNFGNYSGTNTNSMSISNVQLSNHMVPIRAISTSGTCKDTSNIAYVKITDTCITKINDTIKVTKYDTIKVTKYDTITTKITKYDTIKVMDTLVINATLSGISAPNNTNRIIVYPNPAKDHITIDYGVFSRMSGYTVKITNTLGQTVFTSPINQQSSFINLSTWTGKGLYYLQIIDPNSNMIENRKIVLQ